MLFLCWPVGALSVCALPLWRAPAFPSVSSLSRTMGAPRVVLNFPCSRSTNPSHLWGALVSFIGDQYVLFFEIELFVFSLLSCEHSWHTVVVSAPWDTVLRVVRLIVVLMAPSLVEVFSVSVHFWRFLLWVMSRKSLPARVTKVFSLFSSGSPVVSAFVCGFNISCEWVFVYVGWGFIFVGIKIN